MAPLILLGLVSLTLIGYILAKPRWIERKRGKIASQQFPKSWRMILRSNVPYFYKMPADLQLQLKRHILIFLAEKNFYGFEGAEITDEVRVTVAAQACLLLLNRRTNYYPKLKSIYIYPAAFIARHQGADSSGVLQQSQRVLSGESWERGRVILSWRDSKAGGLDYRDGHNVVIHEFAHQLDQETGNANGAPFLPKDSRSSWSTIFSQAFAELQESARIGNPSLFDYYGATNPAEFFAVASEVFFEKAKSLQQGYPQLYRHLVALYRVDPAIW